MRARPRQPCRPAPSPCSWRPEVSAIQRLIRAADYAGTFVFAIEGALAALAAGLDPVGVLVLAFATALGGGIARDLLIGEAPPAAIRDPAYAAIVLAATCLAWWAARAVPVPTRGLVALDAAGLALFAVAGTEKALARGIGELPAIFLGTLGGVGGGTLADLLLATVPRVLRIDVYASAALLAGAVVVLGHRARLPSRPVAIVAALLCFALRIAAFTLHWQLPRAAGSPLLP